MIMKVTNVYVRKFEKRLKEKMKIVRREIFLREKGFFCFFNINSFVFNLIGKVIFAFRRF